MKKFRYTVNGKTYSLPESEVAGFLQEFPNAQLIEEISDTAGKQTGVAEKAVTITPKNVPADGDSNLANTSLESQRLTRQELEEQEKERVELAEINFLSQKALGSDQKQYAQNYLDAAPEERKNIVKPGISDFNKRRLATRAGLSQIARGVVSYIDAGMQLAGKFTDKFYKPNEEAIAIDKSIIQGDTLKDIQNNEYINTNEWEKRNQLIFNLQEKKFTKEGKIANFADLIEEGRVKEAADYTIYNAYAAAPSIAIAYMGGPVGIGALGVSAAGNAFERTMQENPNEDITKAFLISSVQGGVEALSERLGVKFAKGALLAKNILLKTAKKGIARKAVDETLKNYGKSFILRTGQAMLGEGFTEQGAQIINESIQEVFYGDQDLTPEERGAIFRNSWDDFMTGLVLGGSAGSISMAASNNPTQLRENAAQYLTGNRTKLQRIKLESELALANSNLSKAKTEKQKEIATKQKESAEKKINQLKKESLEAFDALSPLEKQDTADTIDEINSGYDLLYDKVNKPSLAERTAIEKQIKNQYKKLERLLWNPNVQEANFDDKYIDQNRVTIKDEQNLAKTFRNLDDIQSTIRDTAIEDVDIIYLKTEEDVRKTAEKLDLSFNSLMNDGLFMSKSSASSKAKIIVNLPVAASTGQTNILGHEKLHLFLYKNFKTNNRNLASLVKSFKEYLVESGNSDILQRIEERVDARYRQKTGRYNKKGIKTRDANEEVFTIFTDIIKNNRVNVVEEKGIGKKLAKAYTEVLQGAGFGELQLTNGKEVFDFLVNYTNTIQKSDAILNLKFTKFGNADIAKIIDSDVTQSFSKSKEIDNAYEAGASPFDLTQLYEPLVNKLINKYKNVPDFSVLKEDLVQNALYEKGGVIDLVNSFDGRGELSGYVGKLLPLRMNKMASDLFGQKFTDDVTERVDVAATETLPEQVEREETQRQELAVAKTQEKRNILDRANLSSELQLKALNASKKILGTMLPQIDIKKGKNFREKYKIAVRNMLFDDVSNELRAYSSPDYNGYIKLNAEALYDIMPLADLTKSQALKNLFLNQQFDKNGKPVRVLESFTGKKSYAGNLVFKKKPFKQIEEAFLNEFAKKHSNSVQRKAFIINTLAKEIAFDESMEALNDPTVQEKIPLTQETAVKEFMEEFEMNIQRGRFTKYSKSNALDNWIAESEDFALLQKINNALPAITKLMNPTGSFKINENLDFGTAFVQYFEIPKKYVADIENDLNTAFRNKIVLSLGTFNLKGAKKGDDPRPLKLGVFGDPLQQDKAYDYVANRLTNDKLAAKSWSTEYGKKRRDAEYHDVFKTFASEYLNNADVKTDALTQNVYRQMVDKSITDNFAGNIDNFLGFEKGKRGSEEINGVKRITASLSTFAGEKQIKKFGIKELINDINNGDSSKVDAHNKYVSETVRPQYKRILLSLYDFVENSKGSPNENIRKKFAVRFATMMFKGGNTFTPFRESAFITHVAKNVTTPYAEHAKPIEALGEDFMVGQDGDNFLAAFTKGDVKGKKILEKAIDKTFNTNGVFIIDKAQADVIESLHGKVEIPNKTFITSRLQDVLNEGDINIVQSGINLTNGNTYDLTKGLNAEVEKAIVTDKRNNNLYIKFSKSAPAEFSEMLDRKSKNAAVVRSDKDFALAANLGKKANYKNKWNIFLPYSAEDFYGLLQKTAGSGKQGDADLKFIKEKFLDPYDRGISNLEIDRRALLKKYRELKKEIKATPEKLNKNLSSIGLDAFTVEDAVRMFIWKQQGMAVPNISKTNANKLSSYVEKNSDLRKFAFGLIRANKSDKYPEPDNNWFAGNIGVDLSNSINKNKRSKYLETWNKNINLILNDKNKTKLTAAFGTDYVKNLEGVIARMKSGTNRRVTDSKIVNGTLDFINGSVGTIMFFNMRSASLQLISAANYLNWSDNNPLQAGKALANVPQYTKDLLRLLNSDFLVNRRNGLKINIQEAELADAVKSDNKFKAIMATILKAGFIPTQIADSLAIAGGGATFYRNRLNTYLKEGLSEKNAESKAYNDWRQIANDSQQSSDASRISNIQASDFGRLVFAFANTPFQYTRLTKKAANDLINNRGDAKTNISKIVYYMAVQNLIFNFLQNALFAAEAEEDETKLQAVLNSDKVPRVVNNMSDSVLRGLGFTGAVISMIKNTGLAYYKEKQKDEWRQDSSNVLLAITDISPPLDHKARKVKALMEIGKYENDIPDSVEAAINVASILNIPLDRVQRKLENIQGAMDRDLDNWVRAFQLIGWSEWELKDSKNKKAQRTILKTK